MLSASVFEGRKGGLAVCEGAETGRQREGKSQREEQNLKGIRAAKLGRSRGPIKNGGVTGCA